MIFSFYFECMKAGVESTCCDYTDGIVVCSFHNDNLDVDSRHNFDVGNNTDEDVDVICRYDRCLDSGDTALVDDKMVDVAADVIVHVGTVHVPARYHSGCKQECFPPPYLSDQKGSWIGRHP